MVTHPAGGNGSGEATTPLGSIFHEATRQPARRSALAQWIREQYGLSVRRAIELAQFSRGGWHAKGTARDQSALRLRIREIAHSQPRFGYLRIHVMLRREGCPVNKKRVYRWYRLGGLLIRMRVRRRKHMCLHRDPVPQAQRTHERWSMDFVHGQLFNGRPFRVLTVIDQFNRQTPLLEAQFGFSGREVPVTCLAF